MKLAILLISILLISCSKPIECKNITINNTIETIKYINITKEINKTCPKTPREIELIRRLKFLENQQDNLIINETECTYNITEEKFQNCEDKLDMLDRDVEEIEEELEDCEEEMCEWNSSWC